MKGFRIDERGRSFFVGGAVVKDMKNVEKKVTAQTAEAFKAPTESNHVTEKVFFTDTYLFELEATLVDQGEGYLIFDKTIFHP